MPDFLVYVQEVHTQLTRITDVADEKEARERVANGEGDFMENGLTYRYTLDNVEEWEVEEE